MADVFLSYASEDLALARAFAELLGLRGWSVWWDHKIPPGMTYPEVIERELDACRCVIVMWSVHSVTSEWVKREVAEGDNRQILAPVRLDDARIPFQFRLLHATDLRGWRGELEHADLQEVFDRVSQLAPPKVTSATAQVSAHQVETSVVVAPRDAPAIEPGDQLVRSEPAPTPDHSRADARSFNWFLMRSRRYLPALVIAVAVISGSYGIYRYVGAGARQYPQTEPAPTKGAATAEPPAARSAGGQGPVVQQPITLEPPRGSSVPPKARPAGGGPVVSPAAGKFRPDMGYLPNDALLGFVLISGGSFTMGSDKASDPQSDANESPPHPVTVKEFYIGRYEVTVAQFKACVDGGGCQPDKERAVAGPSDWPVRNVSWYEAIAYCGWLEGQLKAWSGTPSDLRGALAGTRDGTAWHITLPSEAEWEKAARGSDGRKFPWGNALDPSRANYGRPAPRAVGSFPAGKSPDGLMDMAGNVWEWTRSLQRPYPYRPEDGRENLKAPSGQWRVLRGGSFDDLAVSLRAASRNWRNPKIPGSNIGFRVVSSRS